MAHNRSGGREISPSRRHLRTPHLMRTMCGGWSSVLVLRLDHAKRRAEPLPFLCDGFQTEIAVLNCFARQRCMPQCKIREASAGRTSMFPQVSRALAAGWGIKDEQRRARVAVKASRRQGTYGSASRICQHRDQSFSASNRRCALRRDTSFVHRKSFACSATMSLRSLNTIRLGSGKSSASQ